MQYDLILTLVILSVVALKIGSGIKKGALTKNANTLVLTSIILAAIKVGTWFKTTGLKIAKFALKVESVVTKVASKVVGWIPGIGKPVGRALEGI